MKVSMIVSAIAAASFVTIPSSLMAQSVSEDSEPSWVVYRGSDGEITADSKPSARKMIKKAAQDGYISLWLIIDHGMDIRTVLYDDERFAPECIEILKPMVNRGVVWHPTQGPTNTGPICFVRASAAGLNMLLQEQRFRQIMGSNPPFPSL